MRDPITSDDIRYHVQQMTAGGRYDVDAIVAYIIQEYGLVDLSDTELAMGDELWEIVWEHELDDPLDVLGRELADARTTVREVSGKLREAVRADAAEHGTPETTLAMRANVDRMTVRKWLGKG